METILNVIILILEVLYYTLFMTYSREGKRPFRFLILFTLITVFFMFVGKSSVVSYLVLVLMMLYGTKYLVRLKTSLFDMLIIVIMLVTKIIIETPLSIILYSLIGNIYIVSTIVCAIKLLIVVVSKVKLGVMYRRLHELWDDNNFYIRYIFSALVFLYVIATCLFLIINWL